MVGGGPRSSGIHGSNSPVTSGPSDRADPRHSQSATSSNGSVVARSTARTPR